MIKKKANKQTKKNSHCKRWEEMNIKNKMSIKKKNFNLNVGGIKKEMRENSKNNNNKHIKKKHF